jgi:hypothetical protein
MESCGKSYWSKRRRVLKNVTKYLAEAILCIKQIRNLATSGGRDGADTTRKIMARLFSHDLALQYNWKGSVRGNGKESKHGFVKTNPTPYSMW